MLINFSLKLHSALLQLFRRYVELGDLSKASNGHRIRIQNFESICYLFTFINTLDLFTVGISSSSFRPRLDDCCQSNRYT